MHWSRRMYQLTHPVGCLLICEDLPGFMLAAKLANGKSLETLRAFTWFLTPGGVSAFSAGDMTRHSWNAGAMTNIPHHRLLLLLLVFCSPFMTL